MNMEDKNISSKQSIKIPKYKLAYKVFYHEICLFSHQSKNIFRQRVLLLKFRPQCDKIITYCWQKWIQYSILLTKVDLGLLQNPIMEILTAIVNRFKQLAIAIKGFILDVAGVLDQLLNIVSFKIPLNKSSLEFYLGFHWGFNHKLNHSLPERLRKQTVMQFYL